MKIELTPEQEAAVKYGENKPAIVVAAAGSGKTRILIERIVYLISHKELNVSADRLVATTFTKKAAFEIRERLEKAMNRLIKESPDDEFLREQQLKLSDAVIGTIDSFCLSLLRDNAELLDVSPDFLTLDEVNAEVLSRRAADRAVTRMWKEFSDEKIKTVFRFFRDERSLKAEALGLSSFLETLPDKNEWLKENLLVFEDEEKYREKFCKPLEDEAISRWEMAQDELSEAYVGSGGFGEKVKLYLNEGANNIDRLVSALEEKNTDDFLKIISDGVFKRAPAARGDDKPDGEVFKFYRDRAKALVNEGIDLARTVLGAQDDMAEELLRIRLLLEFYELYSDEYKKAKLDENAIDFSDVEHKLLEILRSPEGQRKNLSRNYDYIIVDEFQDSNDVQFEIFSRLSDNGKNLFFVGDVRQSIYGFRGANPQLFVSVANDESFSRLPLNNNFRSSDSVINFVNSVFCDEDNPTLKDFLPPMNPKREIASTQENLTDVVCVFDAENAKSNESESAYVAQTICDMVRDGFEVTQGKEKRPCRFGDFAILMRSGGAKMTVLRDELVKRGVPVVTKGETDFTSLSEISLVVSMLKVIENPFNNLALAEVLMSPVYAFCAGELAQIRLVNDKNDLHSNLSSLEGIEGELGDKIRVFLSDFRFFRKLNRETSTVNLLHAIYSRTELPSIEGIGFGGEARQANLRLLLDYASAFTKTGSVTAGDFAAFISEISAAKLQMKEAVVNSNEDESVKILTIHASKGLQYPIVFLSFLNKKPNSSDSRRSFLFDIKGGIGVNYSDYERLHTIQTASHSALSDSADKKKLCEELRLLYVAMTRAEEKLILTFSARPNKDGELSTVKGSLLQTLEELDFTKNHCRQVFVENPPLLDAVVEEKADKTIISEEKVREKLSFSYKYKSFTTAPAKLTATELGVIRDEAGEGGQTTMYLGLPLFLKNRKKITPKERGDIYHKTMEHLDFCATSAALELERLKKERVLSEDEAAVVNENELQTFLESDLCKRARDCKIFREYKIFTLINATQEENPCPDDLSFVQGIADMYFVENGEIVLVDYKTNRGITEQELSEEYKGQLKIYSDALSQMTGLKVKERLLYSFSLGKAIEV